MGNKSTPVAVYGLSTKANQFICLQEIKLEIHIGQRNTKQHSRLQKENL